MKKWFPGILCFLLVIFCGCRADPDLILQNGTSAGEETVMDSSGEEPSDDGANDLDLSGADGGTSQMETNICAYICGAVHAPGVYELDADSRVFHLVELAGGLTEDADEKSVNLAAVVADGQMIRIPTLEESMAGETGPGSEAVQSPETDSGEGKININTATAEELTELNGIGEAKAEAIVSYREKNGFFQQIDDIMQVDGIGQGTFEDIRDDITI